MRSIQFMRKMLCCTLHPKHNCCPCIATIGTRARWGLCHVVTHSRHTKPLPRLPLVYTLPVLHGLDKPRVSHCRHRCVLVMAVQHASDAQHDRPFWLLRLRASCCCITTPGCAKKAILWSFRHAHLPPSQSSLSFSTMYLSLVRWHCPSLYLT